MKQAVVGESNALLAVVGGLVGTRKVGRRRRELMTFIF